MKSRFWRNNDALPLIMPTLVIMAIFTVIPLLESFRLSFTNANLLNKGAAYVGLQNYGQLLGDPVFWQSLLHSLVLTTVVVVLQLVFGFILAAALKQDIPGVHVFRSVIMASWVIPVAATAIIFQFMVEPGYGFYNILLKALGFNLNRFWFGDLHLAFPLIIVLHLWRNVPFYGIALLAAMQAIPKSEYEAAEIDGAGFWRRFVNVTLPGTRNMVIVMVTIHVLWTFNNFDMVYLSTGGGPVYSTMVLPVYLYQMAWSSYTIGYASSIGTVMFLVLMAYFIIYIRRYQRQEA
ncbi:MAG TPA: sugar ABC transporter permease [Rectinemataceae bacterium]|nr:sugar ABC transporter permease [Rectinemataceae bacterium]